MRSSLEPVLVGLGWNCACATGRRRGMVVGVRGVGGEGGMLSGGFSSRQAATGRDGRVGSRIVGLRAVGRK
jgi:hypothetical protein